MRLSSVSQLEARGIQLGDTFATDVTIDEITNHWGCSTEEVLRDGLGPFDFVVLYSDNIGFWAMVGSKAHPETGASVWAQPSTPEADLIAEVKRTLKPIKCRLMRSHTGEVIV